MKKIKHLSLRIDEELLEELHYVSEYDGRSANNEILFLIRRYVADFKERNGGICAAGAGESAWLVRTRQED